MELAAGQLHQMGLLDEAKCFSVLPLLIDADGVKIPFRPEGGKCRTMWSGVKVRLWLDWEDEAKAVLRNYIRGDWWLY